MAGLKSLCDNVDSEQPAAKQAAEKPLFCVILSEAKNLSSV